MTESEWQTSFNARKMITALSGKGSSRLWRLYAVACVRGVEFQMRDERSRRALDVAEQFADGFATRGKLHSARIDAEEAARQAHYDAWMAEAESRFTWSDPYRRAWEAACAATAAIQILADDLGNSLETHSDGLADALLMADLLREIFGNPFRWYAIDSRILAHNNRAAVTLAETIYETRVFDRLPFLADALEEAGCTDADILSHLRSPGPHVRGCWALDLILGKE